jgi:hypothetical protein
MKIVSHVILMVAFPTEMPPRVVEQWSQRLQWSAERIQEGIKTRIPDSERFGSRIAESSHLGYKAYVSKDFKSRAGLSHDEIMARHINKLKDAYEKYKDGVNHIYETVEGEAGKRFRERVAKAKSHYAKGAAKTVLAFAGTKLEGKGPAPKAAAWLSGDMKIVGDLSGGDDILEGGPFLITTPEKAPGLRSVINQRLIQAGVIITDCSNDHTIMKQQNDLTNETVQGFVNKKLNLVEFQTEGDSKVDYFVKEGLLYLEVKVSQK